ncbi:MAG: FAD-binding oxidoreductase [Methylobacter sp.]|uniref:FAD-binding oxidoreductase n=1 Tax=Methylobacter sp. TaxID=2051955 RepID=UPI00258CEC2C|nr:FAD-binding oxidoreductase [Methylobacter sp.]MCL7421589.1 FAD-binding oxidoreductase [Methylobacter sp.]
MTEQNYAILPPGVESQAFHKAVQQFRQLLGNENVLIKQEQLVPYMKIMMSVDEAGHAASAVLTATNVEQVLGVVRICNEHKIPVWTVSTGHNFGYGTAAPHHRGQIILDLKKMNKIIEIDPDLCTALVEPGVTYQQLADHIKEKGYKLWVDPPAPSAIVGPVGNTLDRGVGYTPYAEHFTFQCGMEVVLANGKVLRTGMGGVRDSNTWQVFKWGYGPYLDGIFTQSNFGIVTKMGLWLMPQPDVFRPFAVKYRKDEDIKDLVEMFRPLSINGIIPNGVVFAGTLYEASATVRRSDYTTEKGATSKDVIQRIRDEHNIGAWTAYGALYGTQEQVDVNWRIVIDRIKKLGKGEILTEDQAGSDPAFKYRADLMRGNMTLTEFGLYNWRGGGGSMWFAPLSQAKGSETIKQVELATRILNKHGLDYVGEFILTQRALHHVIDVLFDRTDTEEMTRAHDCFAELLGEFEKNGYGVYRVNTAFMDRVANSFGPVQREVNKTLKRALDPNNILAPGKSGIDLDT